MQQLKTFILTYRHILWALLILISLLLFLMLVPVEVQRSLLRGLLGQRFVLSMLLLFTLLSLSLLWSAGQHLDARIFLLFNLHGSRPPWLDWIMLGFTQMGNGLFSLALAGLFFFTPGRRHIMYILVLGTHTLWLVVELVKALVQRSRPFISLTQTRIVGYRERGRSFPSGHTTQAFFLAAFLVRSLHMKPLPALLLYLAAGAVGITRMYVGAHYPRDVLAGGVLGTIWGILSGIIDQYFWGVG